MSSSVEAKSIPAASARAGLSAYMELMKLRLVTLVLITTAVGFCLGYAGLMDATFFVALVQVVGGTALVAGGAMALNQYMERETDALMRRTMERPLPTGRVTPGEALAFGVVISVLGLAYLAVAVNLLTSLLALLTLVSYIVFYTPLKTRTPLCTLVGAVPGAIPPMMGYVAARGTLSAEAWILFAILFAWQMPHFFAIAWLYRADYARGRQMMLPVVDPSGVQTSRQVVSYSLVLLPVTMMPAIVGMAGVAYFAGAILLGLAFLMFGLLLAVARTDVAARQLFLASVLYLPALLGLMVFDRIEF